MKFTAMFEPADLAEGYYNTTATFVSNDPNSPHSMPVTLLYGDGASAADDIVAPLATRLLDAYPNPFNPRTAIAFSLEEQGAVQLAVFDLRGRLVRSLVHGVLPAGAHEIIWDGTDEGGRSVASGTYFARFKKAESGILTRKLALVR